ncbi:TonB-dependent IMP dehydrogenase [Ameyamaea chiangmaiensis NBRC 103196]|uniref:TonB-dependent receptor n=1 Tax=Ameyamaea chiangmaiensis TaxID=442969 RepID=A0A850P3C0_9PROT|nr:TonB-dependent receptor [Ameyamaea chiangmaiensis]MBS4074224.1 TonB-dependent receptor [Ameyamaea chiangmaiensis]NVN39167.1 TonB-dependent receptor [Ameyamaea chiangmaiensis]GBQ71302.1 TonB-dependent IMP dehydrogenase [Ameyamaea chiangmaiensis NBRC 103196]
MPSSQPTHTPRVRVTARSVLLVGLFGLAAAPARGADATPIPSADHPADMSTTGTPDAIERITVTGERRSQPGNPDATGLFRHALGFSTYNAGGVSALPVLNGMADDRVATLVDGVRIAAACPNHMNPALSYVDPDSVSVAEALAGITPVSDGGDSIGGTIKVERRDPLFASDGKLLVSGHVRGDYRSNGGGSGASGTITVAGERVSLRYTGSYAHASNYREGGDGRQVRSTSYLTFNHAVTLGLRREHHQLAVTVGQQDIPYEGFPNQYMDMTNNRSTYVNGKYTGDFSWGTLEARGFWQRVDHAMNMMGDKGGHSDTTGMPMNTQERTAGYALKATIPLGRRHTLGLGSSFDHNGLNDWWPPLTGSMMMGPGTFHTINDGRRDRLGHYIEWNARWTRHLSTQLGLRNDVVMMNTGPVAPYSWTGMMSAADAAAAQRFNASARGRTDVNFDVTATARWTPRDDLSIEGGYARKTRSPNLYERYAWGMGSMATQMIGWFGDGNGYVGNLALKPEVANTASVTFDWHDPHAGMWSVKVQPFFTYTHDYINVRRIGTFSSGLATLQFVNHNAQSYGINNSVEAHLWSSDRLGAGHITANLNWVRGQDLVSHSGLYHQMPANGSIALHEVKGRWTGRVEMTFVKAKGTVDWLRAESRTPGYALLGLGGSYRWRNVTVDAGIDNVLNQKYDLPLGGLYLGTGRADPALSPVAGMGRSFNVSLTASF